MVSDDQLISENKDRSFAFFEFFEKWAKAIKKRKLFKKLFCLKNGKISQNDVYNKLLTDHIQN